MMKKIIFYIVTVFCVFNSLCVWASNSEEVDFGVLKKSYSIRDYSVGDVKENSKETSIIKSNSSFAKFLILPYLIDKLYPEEEIYDEDVTYFLHKVYPSTDIKKLEYLGDMLKAFVISKREYKKIVGILKERIRAKNFIPKEARIVAKDGEFASNQDDLEKVSQGNEYRVSNNLYKYLEYAAGELGNPVRRRDKNFEEAPDVDELVVALLEFDIRGIIKAIKKMPKFNDGSAEKPFIGDNDVRARILLDTYKLGKKEKIKGVIQVNVPNGFYINGDFIDEKAHPYFVMKENKDVVNNIKEYNFYLPMASGAQKNGKSKRVLTGMVSFPFEVSRSNLDKDMYIGGDFYFELCKANGECERYKTQHGLRVRSSLDDGNSIYYNYVTQAHAHLPKVKAKDAKLNKVYFDAKDKRLDIVIDTNRKFSNVAVMVEDALGTNFLNPKYQIRDDVIVASFDVSFKEGNDKLSIVGVSASFDDLDTFRIKSEVNEKEQFSYGDFEYSWWKLFLFGIIVNLFPGVFYFMLKNICKISANKAYIKEYGKFLLDMIGVFSVYWGGCVLFGLANTLVCFCILSLMIEISIMFEILRYMDFNWFRPLKNVCKIKSFNGIFGGIILLGLPYVGGELFYIIEDKGDFLSKLGAMASFWGGVILPGLIGVRCGFRKINVNVELLVFNLLYGVIYVGFAMWFLFVCLGIKVLLLVCLGLAGMLVLWYNYPIYIGNQIKGNVKSEANRRMFCVIQYKMLLILVCIYLGLIGGVNLLKKEVNSDVSIKDVEYFIENNIKNDKEVLVCVMQPWAIKSLLDRITLRKHYELGLSMVYIDGFLEPENAHYWQKRYKKKKLPLYVLFTARHKDGLVLPDSIIDVNFFKAVKVF